MQLVEMPYTSLAQEIQREVDENPALESYSEDEDFHQEVPEEADSSEFDENGDPVELSQSLPDDEIFKEDYYRDDDIDDYPSEREIEYRIDRFNAPEEDASNEHQNAFYSSLQEQWQLQLSSMDMTEHQRQIADYLVGDLDEGGYLSADLQAIANELLYLQNIYTDVKEVEEVLVKYVQELDPAGIGARNLRECLLLQLARRSDQNESIRLAIRIIEETYPLFIKKHYDKIKSTLNLTDDELKRAIAIIKKLDPRPVDSSSPMDKSAEIIHPDFIISAHEGKLDLQLNNHYVPKVRINKEFSNEYRFLTKNEERKRRDEAERFMKEYVDKANQFIGFLSTREMILYNTMYAIMTHQYQYFLTGSDTDLKPMILKTIAQEVNLDVSTVSRVSNSKYVQTDFGIIPLKHLFSEAVNEEEISSKVVKSVLSDLVEAENKKKPLSDEKLCDMLKDKGYNVARRTVAKYREQLGIPVARMRKEID